MNTRLMHHGIKGQKWGVRRYQNKDGSLTALGKARRNRPLDVNSMDRKEFLSLIKSGQDFVAKKGTELYRSTTEQYEATRGKKYVSVRKQDIATYEHFAQDLYGKEVYNSTYGSTKNLKVAGLRTQAELFQKLYGERGTKPVSQMTERELNSYLYDNPARYDLDILNRSMTNPDTKQYIDELSKMGYDAVVDVVDFNIGYSDGPMVVLKSEDTMRRKS